MNRGGLDMINLENEAEIVGVKYTSFPTDNEQAKVNELLKKALQGETSFFEFSAYSWILSLMFSVNPSNGGLEFFWTSSACEPGIYSNNPFPFLDIPFLICYIFREFGNYVITLKGNDLIW